MNSKKHQKREVSSSKSKDNVKEVYVTVKRTIPVEQLKELVDNVIKTKKKDGSKSSFTYFKPYTADLTA